MAKVIKVKEDCIFYRERAGCRGEYCKALNRLYCAEEDCAFYKSSRLYNEDGERLGKGGKR